MGLLSRLLVGGGIGAGVGGLTAGDDGDVLTRALVGAGAGAGIGAGVGGLLGRLGGKKVPKATQAEFEAAVRELRKAMPGITPQQASQMPSNDFRDALRAALEKKIGVDHPNVTETPIPQQIEKAYNTIKGGAGRVVDDVWGGAEDAAGRVENNLHGVWNGVDRGVGRALGNHKGTLTGLGIVGGLGGGGYLLADSQGLNLSNGMRDDALSQIGMPQGELGLRAFQSINNLPATGKMDDETRSALGRALAQKMQPSQMDGPPAPSLAPHNRR